ncbi:MAG: hypothetical protein KC766_13425 [Myxococcales bacterium]|nr:hypothetical protein [Myxococcales bacterium]
MNKTPVMDPRELAPAPPPPPSPVPLPAEHRISSPDISPVLPPLPPGAPPWMQRARELSGSLEYCVQSGNPPSPQLHACMDRAWEAWYPEGVSWRDIQRTIKVIQRVDEQLRATPPDGESALVVLAEVTRRSLPSAIRRIAPLSTVVSMLRELRRERIQSLAQRQALVKLLGWQDLVERWAHRVIQLVNEG